jgi:putative ABC transport system permease protein
MARELILLALRAISGHRLRSALSMLGIGIGITSVILLTSIGEGTKRYIMGQFTQFGTNLLAVNPGKAETTGLPGALGGSTRHLTLDDAQALERISGVEEVMPMAFGMAKVEAGNRGRSVYVYGVTPQAPLIWQWDLRVGNFWPGGDPHQGANMAVLGTRLKRELFGEENALGKLVWIGGTRFRVTGIMEPKGQVLGMDLDDSAWIPVATAMRLFNLAELMEIDLVFSNARILGQVENSVKRILTERHGGKEDFSVTSQAAMLEVFGNIMDIITMSVGAIAGISLVVGAIGILTMMWIAVGERTNEIGLVRAIGASRKQVHWIFLSEAAALATLGGLFGVGAGLGLCELLRTAIPGLPIHTPMIFLVAALAVSTGTGLISGVMPARRAAALDPIQALRAE